MKRDYKGKPIDGTYQHITESPYENDGETVYATTQAGDINTEFESEEGTFLQRRIRNEAAKNPEASLREIAETVGSHWVYVSEVLLENNVSRYKRGEIESLSDNAQAIVQLKALNADATHKEVAELVDVSVCYVSKVTNANKHLINQLRQRTND